MKTAVAQGQFTIFDQEDGLSFRTFTSAVKNDEGNITQSPQRFSQTELNNLLGMGTKQQKWTVAEKLGNLKVNDTVLIICYNSDKAGEVCIIGTVSAITRTETSEEFEVGSMSLLDKGDKGEQGVPGPDGIYIKTIIEQYFLSTDVNSPIGPAGSVKLEGSEDEILVGQWVDIEGNAKIPIVKIKNPDDDSITTYYRFRRQKYIWSNHVEGTAQGQDGYNITYSVARLDETDQRIVDWCSANDSTFIDGGHIYAHSISTDQLAANAITSFNYGELDNEGNPQGMAIDLEHGKLNSAHFTVNEVGEITATGGTVGGWSIKKDMLSARSSLGVGLYMGSPSGFPEYFGKSLIAAKSLSPVRFFCGSSSQMNDAKFMVLEDGSLYATAAKFTGANVSFDDSVQVNTGSGTSTTLGEMSNIIINLNGTISNLNNTIAELQNQIENLQGRVTGVEKEKDIYGVYFDPNGGSFDGTGELKFIAFNENKTVNLDEVPEPTREYYEFIGWFTTKSGGDQINSETIFDGTTTVYAHWKQNRFKITFTTYTNPDYKEEMWTNDKGQLAADQLPTLRGINSKDEFLGWYSSNRGGNRIDTNTTFNEDTTIYAHWQFTIQFNKLNGLPNSVENIKTAGDGSGRLSSIPSLPYWKDDMSNTDYYCNGWYTLSSGGTKITTSYPFTSSTTVYAQWRVGAVWTITFDPQGGILQGSSDKVVYTEMSGKLNSLPEAYLSNNFEFLGWFVDPSGGARITTDTVFTEDTTVYAHWKNLANSYTITFYDLVEQNNQYVYTPHSEKYETDEFGRWSGTLPQPNGDYRIILVEDDEYLIYKFNGWYTGYRNYIGQAGDNLHEYLVGGNMNIYANYTLEERNGYSYTDVNQDNLLDNDVYMVINDHLSSAIEGSNGDIDIDGRNINCSQTLRYINDEQGWVYTERQKDWYSTLPVPIAHWISTLRPSNNTHIIYLNKEYGDYGGCRICHQFTDASREIFVLPPSTDFSYFGSQAFIAGGIEIWYNSDDENTFGDKLNACECPEDWVIGGIEGDTILVTSFDFNGNFLAQEEFDVVYDPSLSK